MVRSCRKRGGDRRRRFCRLGRPWRCSCCHCRRPPLPLDTYCCRHTPVPIAGCTHHLARRCQCIYAYEDDEKTGPQQIGASNPRTTAQEQMLERMRLLLAPRPRSTNNTSNIASSTHIGGARIDAQSKKASLLDSVCHCLTLDVARLAGVADAAARYAAAIAVTGDHSQLQARIIVLLDGIDACDISIAYVSATRPPTLHVNFTSHAALLAHSAVTRSSCDANRRRVVVVAVPLRCRPQ
jgi:hypothetical protein